MNQQGINNNGGAVAGNVAQQQIVYNQLGQPCRLTFDAQGQVHVVPVQTAPTPPPPPQAAPAPPPVFVPPPTGGTNAASNASSGSAQVFVQQMHPGPPAQQPPAQPAQPAQPFAPTTVYPQLGGMSYGNQIMGAGILDYMRMNQSAALIGQTTQNALAWGQAMQPQQPPQQPPPQGAGTTTTTQSRYGSQSTYTPH